MSGICGIVNFDGKPVDPAVLRNMAEAAAHRGPDGIHYWIDGNMGFAYLALNITPESFREEQPLSNENPPICLVADARVDNRNDLIHILTIKGLLDGREPTDADLFLAAYRCWGEACAEHVIGDFAFAIWDAKEQHLYAARDVIGHRAFYYRIENGRVLFATELKQILAVPEVPRRIYQPAVGAHLVARVGSPKWTTYEGIFQLPPANAMLVNVVHSRVWRYWDIDPEYRIEYKDWMQYVEHFRALLEDAVHSRQRSVRPVGIFLSGGMDSGSLASMGAWLLQQGGSELTSGIRAYCWAFNELRECDERHISDYIADYYQLPVTYVNVEDAWPLKGYPAYGPDRDDPSIGHYQGAMEETLGFAQSDGMGVMWTGNYGDVMIGLNLLDYVDLFRTGQLRTLWCYMQADRRRARIPLGKAFYIGLLRPLWKSLRLQASKSEWTREVTLRRSYPDWIRPEFAAEVDLASLIHRKSPSHSTVDGFAKGERYASIFGYWRSRDVLWLERTHARYGLGYADPWADRRIASFVLAVPQRVIHRGGDYKRLCSEAVCGVMPEDARRRVRKSSLAPFSRRALRELASHSVWDLLSGSKMVSRGYVDEHALQSHFQGILSGDPIHPLFWNALTLEMWLRAYW